MTGQSVDEAAVDAVLTASRTMVAVATRSLGVTPSTAGRMCDRLLRKGLIRRQRARADRREVQVSITAAGRQVVDQATEHRRALIAGILARLPARQQSAVAA